MDNREYLIEVYRQMLKQIRNNGEMFTPEQNKLRELLCSIEGFIDPKYCAVYDSWFDPVTDMWLSITCGDNECSFCKDRPLRPSQVSK